MSNHRLLTLVSAITVGLILLVLVAMVLIVPSLVVVCERIFGSGLNIEMLMRLHFLYTFWLIFLVVLFCLYVRPVRDTRARFILYALGVEILILIAIWILDRGAEFQNENSALTFFSSLVLFLTLLAAMVNALHCRFILHSGRFARSFWTILGLAFFIAGLDEFFQAHERIAKYLEPVALRIGLTEGIVQDLVTFSYAAGGVIFIVIFRRHFRYEMLHAGSVSGVTLLVGLAIFALAVFNDSADVVIDYLIPNADPSHLMNFAEEVLEFTAAILFFASFCIAFMERLGQERKDLLRGRVAGRSETARFVSISLIAGTLLASTVLAVGFRPSVAGIIAPVDYEFSVFADSTDGLDGVDQLLFDPVLGLLVGNERASYILRFDSTGDAQILVHSKSGLVSPDGLAIEERSLYVADDVSRQVFEYAKDGSLIGRLGSGWVSPEGVALDNHGTLYVSDQKLRAVVKIRRGSSKIIASALDGLIAPEQLAFDDRGNLYVTDESAGAVFRISQDERVEQFITGEQGLQCPEAIAYQRSHLYLTDSCSVAVLRFALDGSGGPFIRFTRKYRDLAGIAFDDSGALYVAVGSQYRPHNLILQIRGLE